MKYLIIALALSLGGCTPVPPDWYQYAGETDTDFGHTHMGDVRFFGGGQAIWVAKWFLVVWSPEGYSDTQFKLFKRKPVPCLNCMD